jgi:hypothetical protein
MQITASFFFTLTILYGFLYINASFHYCDFRFVQTVNDSFNISSQLMYLKSDGFWDVALCRTDASEVRRLALFIVTAVKASNLTIDVFVCN